MKDWLALATNLVFLLAGTRPPMRLAVGRSDHNHPAQRRVAARLPTVWMRHAAFVLLNEFMHTARSGPSLDDLVGGLIVALVILRQIMALREIELLLTQVSQQSMVANRQSELQAEINERKQAELACAEK